jgi:two-component system, chemotaxis family, protein-glutamate methylesterase/glutaminase
MCQRDVIAIGGSLGAVDAVKRKCRELPGELTAATAIVIHAGERGHNLLAEIFGEHSAIPVRTAVDGEALERGHMYVAPAGRHLLAIDNMLRLGRGPRENLARPAIDPLFRSVAISFGPRAIAVVLTGVQNDGASGLDAVKRCGGVTVVQNPADAVAPDMPWGASRATDVGYRAPISQMAALLVKLSSEEAGPPVAIPDDIKTEVGIALGRPLGGEFAATIADAVALSCPACGGVLSAIQRSPPLRFRCQVGHAYTVEALANEKETAVDEVMRVALRILEERVALTRKMADEARQSGRVAAARSYEQRLGEFRAHADLLREAVELTPAARFSPAPFARGRAPV